MLRLQVVGQSLDSSAPNQLTLGIERASEMTPDVMAYHVNNNSWQNLDESGLLLPTDCVIYAMSTESTLRDTVDRCNRKSMPLIVVSTGIDYGALEGLNTTAIIAPNKLSNVEMLDYASGVIALAREVAISWKPDGLVKQIDTLPKGVQFSKKQKFETDICVCGINH